ncbi:MAG: lactonase family protein [Gemmatimonadaceae bacterium]
MSPRDGDQLSRRDFVALSALGIAGLAMPRPMRADADDELKADRMLYIGTYTDDGRSKGVYQLRMSAATGALTIVGVAAETTNPSFVILGRDGRSLYAVNEVGDAAGRPAGGATAFRRTASSGSLHQLGHEETRGTFPCYASTDRTGRSLFVANYGSGNVAMFPIHAGGGIGAASAIIQHKGTGPNKERQEGPHAHCAITDPANRFVLVADLGIDRVMVYPFDAKSGTLTTTAAAEGVLAPGAGPRHLAFGHGGRVLYVTNELASTVTAFQYDAKSGALTELQTVPAVSEGLALDGANTATTASVAGVNEPADIHVHPNGRFLYMSNRGHNSIAAFAIDGATGRLSPLQLMSTGGDWPRNFAIDPSGEFLLVANQKSDSIVTLRIDRTTGKLASTGHTLALPVPVCVRFTTPEA